MPFRRIRHPTANRRTVTNKGFAMSLEFIDVDDPEQRDYVLVRPTNYANIPVMVPNLTPERVCMNSKYRKIGQQIKDMEIRSDDVWLAGYPKSGTTWCQEMIWLVCNDLDFRKAASIKIEQRFPTLDLGIHRDFPQQMDPFQAILKMPSPRFIKTHFPIALLPDQMWTVKPQLVHVRRNPKSVTVSSYHHVVCLMAFKGTMDDYLESFMGDLKLYSSFHDHVIGYHNLDYQGNILYLCYEDMKKDLKGELKRVCAFFNKTYSDEQLDTLDEHLSFDRMKNNKSVDLSDRIKYVLSETNRTDKLDDDNYQFIRKGKPDGWKTELTVEQQQRLDEFTKREVSNPEQLKLFQ